MAPLTPWREWIGAPRGVALLALLASAVAMTAATSSSRFLNFRNRYWRGSDGTQVERDARLSAEYHRKAWQGARRLQLRDSLRALARPGVSVRIDPQLDSAMARRIEGRIRLAWTAFAITDSRVPVVLAGLSAKGKGPFNVQSFAALPASAGEACVVVVSTENVREREALTVRDARQIRELMFGCALFARHGLPGATVGAELRRVGWAPTSLGFSGLGRWYWWRGQSTIEAAPYVPSAFWPYFACAAGSTEACTQWAHIAATRPRELLPFMAARQPYYDADAEQRSLLALLQASLPRADFETLWHDMRPFDVAVPAITGREVGDWTHQLVLRDLRPFVSNFSPASPMAVRALLMFVLAAITGAALQTRRTITS